MVSHQTVERRLGREAQSAFRAVCSAVTLADQIERLSAAGTLTKGDGSPVTAADVGMQAIVTARLSDDYPADAIVAEEDARTFLGAALANHVVELVQRAEPEATADQVLAWISRGNGRPDARFWTLDPIDGTKGLLRGGQYAVALALVVDGVVQVGAIACPRLSHRECRQFGDRNGGIALAVRGRGAWWAASHRNCLTQLEVSDVSGARQARVLSSFESSHSDRERLQWVVDRLNSHREPEFMDSQAKHLMIAAGAADVMVRWPRQSSYHDAIWDQAAGSIVIEEAGGRVSDLWGRALDMAAGYRLSHNWGVVATNGRLHDAVLDAVRDASRRSPGRS